MTLINYICSTHTLTHKRREKVYFPQRHFFPSPNINISFLFYFILVLWKSIKYFPSHAHTNTHTLTPYAFFIAKCEEWISISPHNVCLCVYFASYWVATSCNVACNDDTFVCGLLISNKDFIATHTHGFEWERMGN
jgi:hypothetical protein